MAPLFWVRSCDECRRFKPVFQCLPSLMGDKIVFFSINMLKSIENLRLAESIGVDQTPTVKVFCRGVAVGHIIGYQTLEGTIKQLKNIIESECSGA